MPWRGFPLILGMMSVLLASVAADSSVHISYKNNHLVTPLVTSSTLNWLSHTNYFNSRSSREIVIGSFERQEQSDETGEPKVRPIYVCRVSHNGVWVAGGQKEGEHKCTVGFQGSVKSYERYELLENVESAARLNWAVWNKFHTMPAGAVATDRATFVARHVTDDNVNSSVGYTHYIGTYNSEEKLGEITYVRSDGTESTRPSGELLTETEPIRYELKSVKLNNWKKRVLKRDPKILGHSIMKNTKSGSAKMAEAFGYSYNYSMYWGQGHAILKGLNTSITLLNGTKLPDIKWGIEDRGAATKLYSIEIILEPGTAVNVSLKANDTSIEISYTGQLVAYYEDGSTKVRTISGFFKEESMMDVGAEYGPIYFLGNYSMVPTTETPLPTTVTTEMTTTKTPVPPSTSKLPPQPPILVPKQEKKFSDEDIREVDENLIISPKKNDISSMQSDDGGPLSLKDKDTSGASVVATSWAVFGAMALAFVRIT